MVNCGAVEIKIESKTPRKAAISAFIKRDKNLRLSEVTLVREFSVIGLPWMESQMASWFFSTAGLVEETG